MVLLMVHMVHVHGTPGYEAMAHQAIRPSGHQVIGPLVRLMLCT